MHRPQPFGTGGDLRGRLFRHHVPLALASAVLLLAFMGNPLFDASAYPQGDIFSATFPQQRDRDRTGPMDHGDIGSMDHDPGRTGRMDHRGGQAGAMDHDAGQAGPIDHGGGRSGPMDHTEGQAGSMDRGGGQHRSAMQQLTVGTGYVALGLLGLTLLIGPANLLFQRRNPVSNYLRRDVGTWTAVASVVHVIFGLQVHGGGRISDFLGYFVAPDGSLWLNSFGLGNWAGLAALVITVGLLAISSDAALRKLKAGPWKWLQRLNYALFALVILHAFFYGALLRVTSPYTLLLVLTVVAVFVGQVVGVGLWRRRYSRETATLA